MTSGQYQRREHQVRKPQRALDPRRILDSLRVPKPTFIRSRFTGRKEPDAEMYSTLAHLADEYQLGKIVSCYRAKKSNSLNYLVTTRGGQRQTTGDGAPSGKGHLETSRPAPACAEPTRACDQPAKYVFRQHLLSKETVAHEYEVLSHLAGQGYPAPRMLLSNSRSGGSGNEKQDRAWVAIGDALYSVYAFVEGYRPADFWWRPSRKRAILRQAGEALANLHRATAGLEPTCFKWDAYRAGPRRELPGKEPTKAPEANQRPIDAQTNTLYPADVPCPPDETLPGARWRNGDFYRHALQEIRRQIDKPATASSPDLAEKPGIDDFGRSRSADLERLLDQESIVEACSDLSRAVIHGDYAPWNILMQPDSSLFVLDFNAARLDLCIYDLMLATFWFAWRGDHLDLETATELQAGYRNIIQPNEAEIALAPNVFCWLMGRSIVERLRTHYLEKRFLLSNANGLDRLYQMCMWAQKHPQELTRGIGAN